MLSLSIRAIHGPHTVVSESGVCVSATERSSLRPSERERRESTHTRTRVVAYICERARETHRSHRSRSHAGRGQTDTYTHSQRFRVGTHRRSGLAPVAYHLSTSLLLLFNTIYVQKIFGPHPNKRKTYPNPKRPRASHVPASPILRAGLHAPRRTAY